MISSNKKQKSKNKIHNVGNILLIFIATFIATLIILSMVIPNSKKIASYTFNQLSSHLGQTLTTLEISGNTQISNESIISLLGFYKNMPLTQINLSQSNKHLMNTKWLKSSHIIRIFPNTIHIIVTEYQPSILWVDIKQKKQDTIFIVSITGHIITQLTLFNSQKFGRLPKIYGSHKNLETFKPVQQFLQEHQLWQYVTSMHFISDRRWNVIFNGSFTVLLPENNQKKALLQLDFLQQKYNILNKKIIALDLRNLPHIMVKLPKNHHKSKKDFTLDSI